MKMAQYAADSGSLGALGKTNFENTIDSNVLNIHTKKPTIQPFGFGVGGFSF